MHTHKVFRRTYKKCPIHDSNLKTGGSKTHLSPGVYVVFKSGVHFTSNLTFHEVKLTSYILVIRQST